MICICSAADELGVLNPPRTRRHFQQVWEDVAYHEYSPLITATKGGRIKSVVDSDNKLTGEKENLGAEVVKFSPLLISIIGDVTLDDFPDGWVFGNGTTGAVNVNLKRQGQTLLVWTVFPYGTVLDDAKWLRLQEIFEGIPPGNPERNVWKPDMVDTPVPDEVMEAVKRPAITLTRQEELLAIGKDNWTDAQQKELIELLAK
jgi:hypothetical protein